MKRFIIALMLGIVGMSSQLAYAVPSQADLLAAIRNPHISPRLLLRDIASLRTPASEPVSYWSRIANDPEYSAFERRVAVGELFDRHVKAGTPIYKLAADLGHPTWLNASDIDVITSNVGLMPIELSPDDTGIVLGVPSEHHQRGSGIFLRIKGRVSLQDFRMALLGTRGVPSKILGRPILQIGTFILPPCDITSGDEPCE